MHPIYRKIGFKLKEARKAKDWTQQELAEKAEITTAFLSYLENGSRKGSLDAYIKLAEALGLDFEGLFKGENLRQVFSIGEASVSLEGLTSSDRKSVKNVVRSLRQKKKNHPKN